MRYKLYVYHIKNTIVTNAQKTKIVNIAIAIFLNICFIVPLLSFIMFLMVKLLDG